MSWPTTSNQQQGTTQAWTLSSRACPQQKQQCNSEKVAKGQIE
jgi:hypothetical protein